MRGKHPGTSLYRPEYAIIAGRMRKMRMPVAAIAATLGVTERTTWNW